jgi:hypothetical protein
MNLDPKVSDSWNSLLDAMRPPRGYTIASAFGTTYGLSIEMVMASLIAMNGADAAQLANNPVAGVLSATRLESRVRIFFQDGRCQVPSNAFPTSLGALLESIIVPVDVPNGEFHPKIWALSFVDELKRTDTVIRLVIASRNLTQSRSLEAGVVLEGKPTSRPNTIGMEVARGIRFCLSKTHCRCRGVVELANLLDRTCFDEPHEAQDLLDILWQDSQRVALVRQLPTTAKRAVVVSPFLSPSFIRDVTSRFAELTVITTADTLNELEANTFGVLEKACDHRLYTVDELSEATEGDDAGYIDGIHAKIILTDNGKGSCGSTLIGSANATGQGWALGGPFNIEAIAHLKPGIGYDRFLENFIHATKTQLRPWIKEFTADDRIEVQEEVRIGDQLRNALAKTATAILVVAYDRDSKNLHVTCESDISGMLSLFPPDTNVEFLPFAFNGERPDWRPIGSLVAGRAAFGSTELRSVSAFIIIRATHNSITVTTLAVARLDLSDLLKDERGKAVRDFMLSQIPREQLLAALILGDYRGTTMASLGQTQSSSQGAQRPILSRVSLEQMLQALAANPDLMREVQVLLGNTTDTDFNSFCQDLVSALNATAIM